MFVLGGGDACIQARECRLRLHVLLSAIPGETEGGSQLDCGTFASGGHAGEMVDTNLVTSVLTSVHAIAET